MKQILEFDSITLAFGFNSVLSSVSMSCETGEVVGLLGRNGAGKSCLMKAVFGSLPVEFKSVRVNKKPLFGSYLSKKIIGYLPQDSFIPPYVKIGEAIKNFHIAPERIIEQAQVVKDWLNLKPDECSGGSLRLIETMILLFSEKPFCLLDEPFSGLMPLHVELVKKIILSEKRTKGIIISDHLYQHVKSISDKIYVLSNGQTYLMKNEEHLVKHGYLSKI